MKGDMKTFLTKLKSSLRLDRARSQSPVERVHMDEHFSSLDRRLREGQPADPMTPDLHASIMQAVRGADREQRRPAQPRVWRWATASVAVLVVGLAVWWSASRPAGTVEQALQIDVQPMIIGALGQGREFTEKAPDVALSPLVGEMELLNRDVQSAVSLVVATVP